MLKKYLPLIVLAIAAASIWFIKSHQRGHYDVQSSSYNEQTRNTTNDSISSANNNSDEDFNRSVSQIIYSKHARCRMDCRHINEDEVKEILKDGTVNEQKIEEDSRGKTYPVEGISQGHHLRIVFAPKENNAVEVVTCIDLDADWQCDCN